MPMPERKPGGARATGPLSSRATAGLSARATRPLPETPPGWLAPAIAACGILGAALGAFGLVWHQTRLDLPAAAYTPRRPPSVSQDAWPLYHDADRDLRLPRMLEKEALRHFRSAHPHVNAAAPVAARRGLLVGAREPDLHDWLATLVAKNPGPLAALTAARARPGFRVIGVDATAPSARWEEFEGLGALAIAAARMRAPQQPGTALSHVADGVALGARLLLGGGPYDWTAGGHILVGLGETLRREWPRLVWAGDAELAAFGQALEAAVPAGDAGAWLLRGGLDLTWREVPAHARAWRASVEANDPTFSVLFARPLRSLETPRATRLVRGVLADVGGKILADRRRGKVTDASQYPLVPFLSQTWQLVLIYGVSGDASPSGVMRVAGVGAVSVVLHPDQWGAYLLAESLTELLTADMERALRALAEVDGMRIRVALERFKRQAGQRPDRLEALVPRYLRALPRDPFAPGRTYRWEAGKLWSTGPDGEYRGKAKDDVALI